ncbi:MAG TPA: FAD-dependent oxidoreductase [Candidatus Hydrogenedens sp.]|nr:FAD-dependent oxidoreductase [Candidatus Hydrogenedens sp.]HOK10359.1 FAD-dependent oxidoreductase [Candidatus Hydrogenedens sp.]HOL20684.1 FAD-dependent oxidoreductase [Candidatus Hydrogenedens sp.]HPP59858.1 FAD-dependent oxidoreductase [Candidatus Hydrogenedens sp.]
MKVAVIGAGIAGLTTAYFLSDKHKVFVYEKSNRPGGGIFSIKYKEENLESNIDLGFTVYNRTHYPNLVNLLDKLNLRSQEVPKRVIINYSKQGLCWCLGEKFQSFPFVTSYFKPVNYRVMSAWKKLKKQSKPFLNKKDLKISLSEYLDEQKIPVDVQNIFILPLVQSFWCGLTSTLKEIPAYSFFSFLDRMGFLDDDEESQWRVVRGGAFRIISQIISGLIYPIRFQTEVTCVRRHPDYVEITTRSGEKETFDAVVIATPADEALKILEKPTESETAILGSYGYEQFSIAFHKDERFAQTALKTPFSWYIQASGDPTKIPPVITWDINQLQQLPFKSRLFLTIAPREGCIPKDKLIYMFQRKAPKATWKMLSVQRRFSEISGMNRTYYCSDYWGEGMLEDSIETAMQVVQMLSKEKRNI